MTNKQIVTTFLEGFNNPSKIQESLALLANDYQFRDPIENVNSKSEFIVLAGKLAQVLIGVTIVKLAQDDNWVAVNYIFTSNLPHIEKNEATEWFRIENGVIQESHLLYDTFLWRKVFENMEQNN